jgi:DNA repair exonuclease SbcCD ATPase subunit
MTVRERVVEALRRTLGDDGRGVRSPLDEAALLETQQRARKACENAVRLSQGAGATAAQQKSALDAAADQARMLAARGRDIRVPAQQLEDALQRSKLIALNAGLEGARIGEPAGKALVSVADEMRALTARALEALDEHFAALGQLDRDREKLLEQIAQAQQRARDLADELLRSQASQREAETALAELGRTLEESSATDPETARALTDAAEHARQLARSLAALSARGDRGAVVGALGPALKPLFRLLRDLYRGRPREEQP